MSQLPEKVRAWLPEPLSPEVRASVERLVRLDDVAQVALMPDVHLAENVCVGAVVAARAGLYPDAVGGDIGCGMAAVQLDCSAGVVHRRSAERLLRGFAEAIPTDRHRRRRPLPAELAERPCSTPRLTALLERDGAIRLGTLGSGNHFLELQADPDGHLWLMVHSGSRALGPAVRQAHLSEVSRPGGLGALPATEAAGRAYLVDHDLAVAYAELNRRTILERAVEVLGTVVGAAADWTTLVSATHNFVRLEEHFGERFWVHRKGAMSAREGELGIIPGSMGTESFLVTGRGHGPALASSSHGAGRAMSRGAAQRRITVAKLERELTGIWFDVGRARHLVDEAPSAYKPIGVVMRAQQELTRIEVRLRPILSYKGV